MTKALNLIIQRQFLPFADRIMQSSGDPPSEKSPDAN